MPTTSPMKKKKRIEANEGKSCKRLRFEDVWGNNTEILDKHDPFSQVTAVTSYILQSEKSMESLFEKLDICNEK